ncbi:MAG: YybH family protein [Gemmatimonadales bacterium]
MRRLLLAAVLGTAAAGCGGNDPKTDPPAQAEVRARFDAWVKAWNVAKPADLAPFYIQKDHLTVAWPDGQRTRGWTQERELQASFLPPVTVMNLAPQSPAVVLVRADLALVTFPFTLDLLTSTSRQIGPGQGTMLWQKEGGAWKIYAAQLSYAKAVEAQLPEPPRRRGAI